MTRRLRVTRYEILGLELFAAKETAASKHP